VGGPLSRQWRPAVPGCGTWLSIQSGNAVIQFVNAVRGPTVPTHSRCRTASLLKASLGGEGVRPPRRRQRGRGLRGPSRSARGADRRRGSAGGSRAPRGPGRAERRARSGARGRGSDTSRSGVSIAEYHSRGPSHALASEPPGR
jgi:hypothetical protein